MYFKYFLHNFEWNKRKNVNRIQSQQKQTNLNKNSMSQVPYLQVFQSISSIKQSKQIESVEMCICTF